MPNLVLSSRVPDGLGLVRVTFDRGLPAFQSPGQFVTVHLPGLKPAYFALASVPGKPVELLVKEQGDVAGALAALPIGTPVEVSEPIGAGFGVDPADTRPLVILATGSGISAVRSVIEAEIASGLRRPVELFYGVYTPAHLSLEAERRRWEASGVSVRLVFSEPVTGWFGLRGFVQQAARLTGWVRPDVTVVLCGYPAMVEEARAWWVAAGAAPEQVHVNF